MVYGTEDNLDLVLSRVSEVVGIHGLWKFSGWLSARCPGEKKFRYRCLSYDAQAILNRQLGLRSLRNKGYS
jgi:hypothetical protein